MKKGTFATIAISAMLLSGCKVGGNNTNADLRIIFFNGGYGDAWINNLAAAYKAKTGKTVSVTGTSTANCGIDSDIKKGDQVYDLYIGEGIGWRPLVAEGYLADLTPVYDTVVETSKGERTIKDFIDPSIVDYYYSQRTQATPFKPYAMPWTAKPNSMAYNEDILKEIKHVSEGDVSEGCVDATTGKWVNPPSTRDDMFIFFEDVIAFNNDSDEKKALKNSSDPELQERGNQNYVPFGWAGGINADSIDCLIIPWWAEAQGLETSNYSGEGSFYDFYNYGNTTEGIYGQQVDLGVFRQSGLIQAYNLAAEIIADQTTHDFNKRLTLTNPNAINLQNLQRLFVSTKNITQKPVLVIASSYLENEVIKNRYIDSDKDGKQDVTFKFMNVPNLSADSDKMIYLNYTDSMVVPQRAPHKDEALEFLKFMNTEDQIINFAKDTNGGIRPFDCVVRTEENRDEYSIFANSLFDVYYNSVHFCQYPANAESIAHVSSIYRYKNQGYQGSVNPQTVLLFMKNPGEGKTPGQAISEAIITSLSADQLSGWIDEFELIDITQR